MSVAGSPNRNNGLLALLLCCGAFVLGASTGERAQVQRLVLRAAFLSGGIVGLLAILEWFGIDLLGWGDLGQVTRARSTWGNASFAGAHLVIVLPIAVAHLRSRERLWRNLAIVATAAMGGGLLATGSRAAWLAVVVAAILTAPAWRAHTRPGIPGDVRSGLRANAIPIVIGVVVVVGSVFVVAPNLNRSSAVGRIDLWRTALPVIADRPLLGSGPDTGRVVLPAGIDASFERKHGSTELHDRAHDIVLDTAVTTGLAGVVALGALAFVLAADVRRRLVGEVVPSAIAAGLTGYLITLLFSFGDPTIDPIVWLLAGILVAPTAPSTVQSTGTGLMVRRTAVGLLVVATVAAGLWSGGEVLAEYRLSSAMEARGRGELRDALATLGAAADVAPARFDLDQLASRIVTQAAVQGTPIDPPSAAAGGESVTAPLLSDAFRRLDRAHRIAGDDPDVLMDRAELLSADQHPRQALAVYDRVLQLYPNSFRAHLGLGLAAAQLNVLDRAEGAWKRAAELGPRDVRALVNLGLLYEKRGDPDSAVTAFERVLEIDPHERAAQLGIDRLSAPKGN